MAKFIFVTGGNVSGIGKGIVAASLGLLIKSQGFNVTAMKMDPYLNVDAGTMNPIQHGEVFVTEDGAETDLDLGHYERFLNTNLSKLSNITTGQVYNEVMRRERHGDFLGGTVQVIPHVTNEIKSRIRQLARHSKADIILVECGGTVGDIEGLPFYEAIRQFRRELGPQSSISLHVTLIPFMGATGELKTKLTQHSVKELRGIGISPEMIICRTKHSLTKEIREKISLFCDIAPDAVIESCDVESIYNIPHMLADQNVDTIALRMLGIEPRARDLTDWDNMITNLKETENRTVTVALVGKYVKLKDAYLSIIESIKHAAALLRLKVDLKFVDTTKITEAKLDKLFHKVDGVMIPYGFGERGVEGKISALKICREQKIPTFGLCLGLQCMVIEFARNVCGLKDANSTEFDRETKHPVIAMLSEQNEIEDLGGTMRLGAYDCQLNSNTIAKSAYKQNRISERHRHRWEVNEKYLNQLEKGGLVFSGINPERNLVEIVELREKDHPCYFGTQFHPEFKSRPVKPHPLFVKFISAAAENKLKLNK